MTKLYKNHHNRLRIILIVCLSFMLVSTTKTFYLQVFKSQDKSIEIQKIVKGDRGVIYDRNLTKLAYDINFYDLYLNKNEITDIYSIKYFLNEYFEYNTSNLDSIINQQLEKIVRYKIFVNDVQNFKSYSCNWKPGNGEIPYVKREKYSEFEDI